MKELILENNQFTFNKAHNLRQDILSFLSHCGGVRFEYKAPILCYGDGKIKLEPIETPNELHKLFTSFSQ